VAAQIDNGGFDTARTGGIEHPQCRRIDIGASPAGGTSPETGQAISRNALGNLTDEALIAGRGLKAGQGLSGAVPE